MNPELLNRWDVANLPTQAESNRLFLEAQLDPAIVAEIVSTAETDDEPSDSLVRRTRRLLQFAITDSELLSAYVRLLAASGVDCSSSKPIAVKGFSQLWSNIIENRLESIPVSILLGVALDPQLLLDLHVCLEDCAAELDCWDDVYEQRGAIILAGRVIAIPASIQNALALRRMWTSLRAEMRQLGTSLLDSVSLALTSGSQFAPAFARGETPKVLRVFEGDIALPEPVAAQWGSNTPRTVHFRATVSEPVPGGFELQINLTPPPSHRRIVLQLWSESVTEPLSLQLDPNPLAPYTFGGKDHEYLTSTDIDILANSPQAVFSA